jgi:1-acyl-sn-glycerol-3-phosphate acyltransferase
MFMKKPVITGLENLRFDGPKVLIANHSLSYGPLFISVFLSLKIYPWVIHQVMSPQDCPAYIEEDFIKKEIHLGRPFSKWLSYPLALVCTSLMKHLKAIPVYKNTKKNSETIRISAEYLMMGRTLLVFPESQVIPLNEAFNEFETGFVHIGRRFFEKYKKIVRFIPIAVNRKANTISIGKSIAYNSKNRFSDEKKRITRYLKKYICLLYQEEEKNKFTE